ncbi:Hpt domain-containing protein [Jeongeupia naejangsanensis]|uniref:Hpt domain-containing protein n=1 Tax=Jeongeupia naejangsanensis TaxID=613195 RepID=A0ABS2BIL4_9NEIS|nr:Hpt domain-containing protein [Jeongeupia naejangsanensis]MBM3115455.1 Hpt domain-containing protein [Jeongeupia naejangsanensis]
MPPPPPPPDLQHELAAIDATFATLALDLGQDLRAELLDAYWPTHEACLSEIGLALQQGQHYLAERAAHQLKGACAQIGAVGMAALCRTIELAARESRLAGEAHADLVVLATGVESALRR